VNLVMPRLAVRRAALAYLELTKPRIISLVMMTGVPAMLLAAHGFPPARIFWGTLLGTVLAAGSAASFNMYVDRDIDALMPRTASRPLPSGVLPPASAVVLGFALAAASWVVLMASANLLAALIGMASIFYYAVIYTIWLKRRTPENIVIGGAAGSSAPLIAWAAVTGHVGPAALVLAAIVFLWTPPHFWSLSLFRREDYARAGIPMLPVTHGEPETRRRILLYSLVLVPATLLAARVAGLGWLYLVPAAALGGVFLAGAIRVYRRPGNASAVWMFHYSIAYLFLLYLVMTADALFAALRTGA
jgi:protoheme IX farnesyltransferase